MGFEKSIYGKWVLTGEHAVLRGAGALVFPYKKKKIRIQYEKTSKSLCANFSGPYGQSYENLFWGVVERALHKINLNTEDLTGHLNFEADLTLGGGLGGSAALCVSISEVFVELGFIEKNTQFEFCKNLEDGFHGKSSGVDIAVALSSGSPLYYKMDMEKTRPLEIEWFPPITLENTGLKGFTSECVKKVQELIIKDPKYYSNIDTQMNEATECAYKSLSSLGENVDQRWDFMKEAFDLGQVCFKEWGLIPESLQEKINEIYDKGASAVKITGSGMGGNLLALWPIESRTSRNSLSSNTSKNWVL